MTFGQMTLALIVLGPIIFGQMTLSKMCFGEMTFTKRLWAKWFSPNE